MWKEVFQKLKTRTTVDTSRRILFSCYGLVENLIEDQEIKNVAEMLRPFEGVMPREVRFAVDKKFGYVTDKRMKALKASRLIECETAHIVIHMIEGHMTVSPISCSSHAARALEALNRISPEHYQSVCERYSI